MTQIIDIPKGLNIPREQLPQIPNKYVVDFIRMLQNRGISCTASKIPANKLKPSQSNLNVDKIHTMMGEPMDTLAKPIIISKGGYILDGHHRWAAILQINGDIKLPVIKVNADIKSLIKIGNEYGKSINKSITDSANYLYMGNIRDLISEDILKEGKFIDLGTDIGIDWGNVDFTLLDFIDGFDIESEHGKDPETDVAHGDPIIVAKIAWTHLKEDPEYYKKLKIYVEK